MPSRQEELELRAKESIIRLVWLKEATLRAIGFLNGLLPPFGASFIYIAPISEVRFSFLASGMGHFLLNGKKN